MNQSQRRTAAVVLLGLLAPLTAQGDLALAPQANPQQIATGRWYQTADNGSSLTLGDNQAAASSTP